MQAQFSQRRAATPQGTRRPLRRAGASSVSPLPTRARLFSTPQARARAGQENPQVAEQENPQVLALSKQVEQLTFMVQSLVSNGKEKSGLPPTRASVSQARVPLPSARAQNVHEHVLLTPQIGRSGGNDFMKRVNNNITQTSRATYASYHQKKEMEQLLHLQNEYRSSIPKLTLVKDTGTANFRQWNSAFLAYLEVLHPDLHSVCKTVSGMDFTPRDLWGACPSPTYTSGSADDSSSSYFCNQKHLFRRLATSHWNMRAT